MITDELLTNITDSYGTPVFIFDEDEVKNRAASIRSIMGDDIRLTFSVKANAFLIPALLDVVDYFEICSPGELAICKKIGVPPEKMLYSGVHKDLWDIREAVTYGAAILTAESKGQYEDICAVSSEQGRKSDVVLRLTSGNQFGMSKEDIKEILSNDNGAVNIIGIHFFVGTGRGRIKRQIEELSKLDAFFEELKAECGRDLLFFEYGPGLPFPYFADEDRTDTLSPLKELALTLHETAKKYTLSVEMGRFIASSCGYYATTVCDTKVSKDVKWCIVDGGINHVNYLGQMIGMKIPVIRHFSEGKRVEEGEGENVALCGSLCTINDVLVRSMPVKEMKKGDMLVFENIGAYSVTESPGLFLSRTLPRVVTVSGGKPRLVRDCIETWEINSV